MRLKMENESKIVERVVKLESKSEQHDKDIIDLKDTTKVLHEMSANIKILALQGTTQTEKIDNIECKVGKLDDKVEKMDVTIEEIKCKPDKEDAQKWRETAKYIIIFFVGSALTLVAKQIGLI